MKNITAEVVDFTSMNRSKRRRLLVVAALLLAIVCTAAAWWLNENVFIPNGYKKSVEQGFQILKDKGLLTDEEALQWENQTEGRKSVEVARKFFLAVDGISNVERIRIAADSLNLAIHLKEPWAYYDGGMAIKDGQLGLANQAAADAYFEAGVKELKKRTKKGEPVATVVYAYLMVKGLGGLDRNPDEARKLIKSVYLELSINDVESLIRDLLFGWSDEEYIFRDIPDEELTFDIISNYRDKFSDQVVEDLKFNCQLSSSPLVENEERTSLELEKAYPECIIKYLTPIEYQGSEAASVALNSARDAMNPSKLNARNSSKPKYLSDEEVFGPQGGQKEKQARATPTPDPEAQEKTGYLKGAPQLSKSGLSTFEVNNTQGDADAIARIYLNGAKPAVRSMYIKRGESFTAKTLPAGTYTLRYRFTGDETTFEAIEPFVLEQTTTDKGTRYSRVTVTLYKVENGNLQTKVVPPDRF
jgi:hypothetical protein